MIDVRISVNGQLMSRPVESRLSLADFLRDQCGLTSVHLGCEHGVCGACTVVVDGAVVRSCITLAVACNDQAVTTLEGMYGDPQVSALRTAFSEFHALQCGFCTPAMIVACGDILRRKPDISECDLRVELGGQLCRCTGYWGIVDAVLAASQRQWKGEP